MLLRLPFFLCLLQMSHYIYIIYVISYGVLKSDCRNFTLETKHLCMNHLDGHHNTLCVIFSQHKNNWFLIFSFLISYYHILWLWLTQYPQIDFYRYPGNILKSTRLFIVIAANIAAVMLHFFCVTFFSYLFTFIRLN